MNLTGTTDIWGHASEYVVFSYDKIFVGTPDEMELYHTKLARY